MTWTLMLNNTLTSGDYVIRKIRGELIAYHCETVIGRLKQSASLLEAKEICRVHYWKPVHGAQHG